jgi:hypothetical protein
MRYTLYIVLGLLCLGLTACPAKDTGDEGSAVPDANNRKPDYGNSAGDAAGDTAATDEAANPCGGTEANPCSPVPTPTGPGGEANPCNPCAPAEGGEANPCNPCVPKEGEGGEANPCNPCAPKEGGEGGEAAPEGDHEGHDHSEGGE